MSKRGRNTMYSRSLLWYRALAISIALGIVASAHQASAEQPVQFEVTIAHASNSGSGIDPKLAFARNDLLGKGYKRFAYMRRYGFPLAKGREEKFSVGRGISALLGHAGVVGKRVQYYLQFYSGRKKNPRARVYYSIEKGALMITVLPQSGGWAYVVIVRALK